MLENYSYESEQDLASKLTDNGLNVHMDDPFTGFGKFGGGSDSNDAKISEAGKILENVNNADFISVLQSMLNQRSKRQIRPGDAQKALSKMQQEPDVNGETVAAPDTGDETQEPAGKGKSKVSPSAGKSKSTILGMKSMYAYILSGVLVALIVAAVYYTME